MRNEQLDVTNTNLRSLQKTDDGLLHGLYRIFKNLPTFHDDMYTWIAGNFQVWIATGRSVHVQELPQTAIGAHISTNKPSVRVVNGTQNCSPSTVPKQNTGVAVCPIQPLGPFSKAQHGYTYLPYQGHK